MTSTRRVRRVGFIGTGAIAEFHARAVGRLRSARLTAVHDLDSSAVEAFARRWPEPTVCPTMEAFWQTGVDVVHVLTPPSTHAAIVLEALAHNCDVFVEKPLATSVGDCDSIQARAREAGRTVAVGHSLLWDPTVRRMLALVKGGAIGELSQVEYLRSQPAPTAGPSPFVPSGGVPFRDAGIHGVYLVEELLGPLRDVNVRIESIGRHRSVLCDEWHVMATCARGTARLHLSYSIEPWQSVVTVYGSRGILRADLFAATVTIRRKRRLPSPVNRLLNAFAEASAQMAQSTKALALASVGRRRQFHGVQDAVRSFYDDLDAGREPAVTASRARSTVEWTERIAAVGDRCGADFVSRFCQASRAPILVTGATGLVGRHLVERLLQDGRRVRLLTRRDVPETWWRDNRLEILFGDLGDAAAVDRAVAGTSLVFHLGATMQGTPAEFDRGTIEGTRHVVQSALAYRARLVHMSSLAVLHLATATLDRPIDEAWPLEPHAESRGDYTRAKLAAEGIVRDAVRRQSLEAIIIRPGEIIASPTPRLTASLAQRVGGTLVMFGNGRLPVPLVAIDDVVEALVRAADRGPFDGTTIHLVDPNVVTQQALVDAFVATSSQPFRIVHVPRVVVMAMAALSELALGTIRRRSPVTRYRMASALSPKRFSSQRADQVLGWSPHGGVARLLGLDASDEPRARPGLRDVFSLSSLLYVACLGYLALLYFRPSEVIPALAGFHLVLGAAVIVAPLMVVAWMRRRAPPFELPNDRWLLGYWAAIGASNLAFGLNGAALGVLEFAEIVFLYFLIRTTITTPRRLRGLALVLVAAMAFHAAGAIVQHDTGVGWGGVTAYLKNRAVQSRSVGIFNDPNDFALGLLLVLPLLAAAVFGRSVRFWVRAAAAVTAVPILIAFYYANSRGAMLGLGVSLCVYCWRRAGVRYGAAIAGCALIVLLALAPSRVATLANAHEGNAQSRIHAWAAGLQMLRNRPITGVGWRHYTDHYDVMAHNSFLHAFSELGLPGGVCFVAIVCSFFLGLSRTWRRRDPALEPLSNWELALTSAGAGFFVAAFFLSQQYGVLTFTLLALGAAYASIAARTAPARQPAFGRTGWIAVGAGTIGVLATLWAAVALFQNSQ